MKLQFKQQKFQADAVKAVVDVFAGQPYSTPSSMIEHGTGTGQPELPGHNPSTGWSNQPITISGSRILEQIQAIQKSSRIKPSERLEGRYNLTIEMETGTGKTYTYIKTMYELNRVYGWSRFIVVVPSIAIREGVYKSFQITQDHFAEEYGKKIRFFIYNSARLTEIDRFASGRSINVMIINAQAFNKAVAANQKTERGQKADTNAAIIFRTLDSFRSRRPIDVIAKTNPILIIDEPQSVEGERTKENLKYFNPLITLRYSATHKTGSIYNMIYRLDALDAYNKQLVKRIAVKGITEAGSNTSGSFLYVENINLSAKAPTAAVQFDCKRASGICKVTRILSEGDNLYERSGQLEEYKHGFRVSRIDGRDNSVSFINGITVHAGEVSGTVSQEHIRRIQMRETILSHIQRERELFSKGIKVLSLFFIDEVAKYKQYDAAGQPRNGIYADMFEEEYQDIISNLQLYFGEDAYKAYLHAIPAEKTHAGYFSIDKKGNIIDSPHRTTETESDDVDAYTLIMKNKELLLDSNPQKSPVRFIFSHSALREGWDNPNVFQICTLKQSGSEIRKRQEVGRGLRLCVNQNGERMDASVLGADVHTVNTLTVIASESYEQFTAALQTEIAEAVAERPRAVTAELFKGVAVKDSAGNNRMIDEDTARAIHYQLIVHQYIDKNGALTEKYYADKAENRLSIADEAADYADAVIEIIDSVYDNRTMQPDNSRNQNVDITLDTEKLAMPEFKALWEKIHTKSVYRVDFQTEELVQKAITALNGKLHVSKLYVTVQTGVLDTIDSKEALCSGAAFAKERSEHYTVAAPSQSAVKYDLIGKLVTETGLTRKDIMHILQGLQPAIFNQFKENPEEFIIKAAALINNEKATAIIEHITYNTIDDSYGLEVFTEPAVKGQLGINAMKTKKHLYQNLVFDSANEQAFAAALDTSSEVAVYVKLPRGFYIGTPVGHYNPDWAIAFYEDTVKHIYFVAETKGSLNSMQLRLIEEAKIHCAREHFKAVSNKNIVYDVVDSYQSLLEKVMR